MAIKFIGIKSGKQKANSPEGDKSIDAVFKNSAKRKHSDCNAFREAATSVPKMSFTSQHHCKQSNSAVKNVHKRNFAGETQLHLAAKKGNLDLVTALVEAGINVNQSDYAGWTAIHEASCKGFSEIVLALLKMGANVNSRGPDGILPIHDAVFGNHLKLAVSFKLEVIQVDAQPPDPLQQHCSSLPRRFPRYLSGLRVPPGGPVQSSVVSGTTEFLLDFDADPYARDDNHENAFDKCCDDTMVELLKARCQGVRITKSEVTEELSIISSPLLGTQRRKKCSEKNVTTLQEAESKQIKLLAAELHTPEDADKYVEEMRHIQGVLNDIAIEQTNERDELGKKYRASVDSFKQGNLRDKLAQLACRQKSFLQLVHNQKRVGLKIIAYQQMKRSHSNNNGKDSSSHYCAKSPGRNPISGLLTHNEGQNASSANGSTMATKMPAVCGVPDSDSYQFQAAFMEYILSSKINGTRDVPVGVLASERTGHRYSNSTFDSIPLGTENALLGLNPFSSLTPADLSTADDQLETAEPRTRSPCSILLNSTITITDKSNVTFNKFNHQEIDERQQNSDICQPLESSKLEEPNQQADRAFSTALGDISKNGRPQGDVSGLARSSWEHHMDSHTVNIQAHTKQQLCVNSERKATKISMRKLISMGKLKPGEDTLSFQLQDYSLKASLLPDGNIRDHSGKIHRDVTSWIKAFLGNDISVSWKYAVNKGQLLRRQQSPVTHTGRVNLPRSCSAQAAGVQQKEEIVFQLYRIYQRTQFFLEQDGGNFNFPAQEGYLSESDFQSHTVEQISLHTFSSHRNPVHTVLQVKDILLFDKSDFFPSHIMDQIWEEFLNPDELDL
ncbi:ankyrin repeat domain-containing protein 31 [Mantella aurantiaca]